MIFRRRHRKRRRAGTLPGLVACALALAVPATALGQQQEASGTGGLEARPGEMEVRPTSLAKRTLEIGGNVGAEGANRTVRVERQASSGEWQLVTTAVADADGAFTAYWRTDAPGRYALRATVAHESETATTAAAKELLGRVSVFAPATASWYGPGFFGRRTACGIKLTKRTLGVAHKKLPCGTKVEFLYGGRTIVVPVIDRGPFIAGRQWDLTQATAEALDVRATVRVGVLPAP